MIDYFLADDLSGALDVAAAFHRAGRRVRVVLSAEAWAGEPDEDVVGVTTETRNARPAEAAAAVTRAIAYATAQGARLVYKKIDSTLRGPVEAELQALAAALPGTRILLAPANPAVGRTVQGGVLRVRGVPVAESEFGRDPVAPVRQSVVREFVRDLPSARVEIPDTTATQDFPAAVAAMVAAGGPWVAVGSGALAVPVAARLSAERTAVPRGPASGRLGAGGSPVLFVGGSAHAANREQAAVLAAEVGASVRELRGPDASGLVETLIDDLRTRGVALILADPVRRDSAVVLRELVAACAAAGAGADVRRWFITGGETAFALCGRLGIASLQFEREIEPGLGISRASGEGGKCLLAVKPGGFGNATTWLRAWRELRAGA